ncbi:hypothetical protein FZC76_21785 [Sutcliffiella horikoshii]|uniref:SprT-like domain-containing protein n=1 Tax=Sutcliffiella horikoshii TaxID=79883 RepID=A0A5D4SEG3_9BACI|nr:hypothetical protein [Sutcliffiella horikoshii]TYS60504.1 hypothetical protein FZC76_21785 [Sutcliffiella horikoshii]
MIPKQLLIGGVPYKVTKESNMKNERGQDLVGHISYLDQTIKVDTDVTGKEAEAKVILHEVVHGLLWEFGLCRYDKEPLVQGLTQAIWDFLRNNDIEFLRANNKPELFNGGFLDEARSNFTKTIEVKVEDLVALHKAEKLKEEQKPSKFLPLTGGSSNSFPLAEVAKVTKKEKPQEEVNEPEEDTSHWETGVKVKDGVDCYRTWYQCPNCGGRGKRYVPQVQTIVQCRECQAPLKKVPVDENDPLARDDFGNYYTAREVVET